MTALDPTERIVGQVEQVEIRLAGAGVVGDHTAGATTLAVEDASDWPAEGGAVEIAGVVIPLVSRDTDTDVLTLAAGLPDGVNDGDPARVDPPAPTTWVHVDIGDGHIVQAEAPFGVKAWSGLTEGVAVEVVDKGLGRLVLADVVAGDPTLDATLIDNGDELRLNAAQKRLGEVLAENEAALEAARTNLEAAEADLARAFGQIEKLAKGIESTSPPGTTVMPKDSVWRQTDGAGKYLAIFVQTAAPSGSTWVPRTIRDEVIDSMDLGKLTVAGSATMRQAVIDSLVAQIATFVKADIGNLTVTDTSNLNTLVAQKIAANVGAFVEIMADQVLAGTINATISIGTSGAIVCGDPRGARVEITRDGGIEIYKLLPNGETRRATTLSATEVSMGVYADDGSLLGGLNSVGDVSGQQFSATKAIALRGIDLGGQLLGGAELGVLDLLPRGIIPGGLVRTTTSTTTKSAGVESAYVRTTVTLHPGRQYRISGDINVNPGAVDCAFAARIRVTTDGSTPGNASTLLKAANSGKAIGGGNYINQQVVAYWQVQTVTKVRLRLSFMGINAAVAGRDANLVVEDLGPVGYDLGALEDGVETVLYRATWNATASRMYDKTGATKAGRDGDIDPFFLVYGTADDRDSAAVLFGGGAFDTTDVIENNKTIPQALAGATIRKVEIYLHNSVWARDDWSQPKGSITVAPLGATALPATLLPDGVRWVPDIPAGQGVRFEVPAAWFANGNLGITIGDKDAKALNGAGVLTGLDSGVFYGPADPNPPQVSITYSR